jgi:membrane fusion protein, heavy metal efflux system
MAWAALTAAALTAAGGCQRMGAAPAATTGSAAAAPAKVDGAPKEADLATVTLTPEAEARLAVALAPVERKSVPRTAMYAGEVTIPSGRLTAVTAPFVGTIQGPPGGGPLPEPGATVKKGQPVLVLQVILTPEARAQIAPQLADAEGQVKQSRDQLQIAKVQLDRAEGLVRDRLGGTAALVDAKAQYELAQTNLRNAETRRDTLVKVTGDINSGSMNQTITAPADGGLQNVHVQAGQVVAAGVALFEVAGLDPVWVKVPVYVGDFARLAKDRPAAVGGLIDVPGAPSERAGKPVSAPPLADPLAATVFVYYEVANKDAALRPGERVGVTLPLRGDDSSLTVPRASLLRDTHGGTWVYEKVGTRKYTRRRILVDRVVGDLAVLTLANLKPGAQVVTAGAAEIFGTEFGNTK